MSHRCASWTALVAGLALALAACSPDGQGVKENPPPVSQEVEPVVEPEPVVPAGPTGEGGPVEFTGTILPLPDGRPQAAAGGTVAIHDDDGAGLLLQPLVADAPAITVSLPDGAGVWSMQAHDGEYLLSVMHSQAEGVSSSGWNKVIRMSPTGEFVWEWENPEFTPGDASGGIQTLFFQSGVVAFDTATGTSALDWETGQPLWSADAVQLRHESQATTESSPVFLAVDASETRALGLDARTGKTVWTFEPEGRYAGSGPDHFFTSEDVYPNGMPLVVMRAYRLSDGAREGIDLVLPERSYPRGGAGQALLTTHEYTDNRLGDPMPEGLVGFTLPFTLSDVGQGVPTWSAPLYGEFYWFEDRVYGVASSSSDQIVVLDANTGEQIAYADLPDLREHGIAAVGSGVVVIQGYDDDGYVGENNYAVF